jgi:hypothetical protein
MTQTPSKLPGAKTITEETIVSVLTHYELNHMQMAKLLNDGTHRETIRRIRVGEVYAHVRPDIPRWERPKRAYTTKSCWGCQHHRWYFEPRPDGSASTKKRVKCGLGFPDPLVHGAKFARECSTFLDKDDTEDADKSIG